MAFCVVAAVCTGEVAKHRLHVLDAVVIEVNCHEESRMVGGDSRRVALVDRMALFRIVLATVWMSAELIDVDVARWCRELDQELDRILPKPLLPVPPRTRPKKIVVMHKTYYLATLSRYELPPSPLPHQHRLVDSTSFFTTECHLSATASSTFTDTVQ